MHDKGYYHSYLEEALVTNTPTIPQALVPLPKTPARATALPAIVRREGILLNPALSVQGGRHAIPRGQDSGNLRPAGQPDPRPGRPAASPR